jgi:hypothetical protein
MYVKYKRIISTLITILPTGACQKEKSQTHTHTHTHTYTQREREQEAQCINKIVVSS